ncbi:MAG: 4-hydroxyproline epimerase [Alphaproteobacteria bacterium]
MDAPGDPALTGPKTFFCIDGHTCGAPVRVVVGGGPALEGKDMSARRQHFLKEYDWIRRALMFEPRGHDLMSGAIVYPPLEADADLSLIFIETTGCLPMCGHGTIGTVTIALEHGLVTPKREGRLVLDVPAGRITVEFVRDGPHIESVKIINVPSFLMMSEVRIDCPGLGPLVVDVAYGGNFYAIIEPQPNFPGLENFSAAEVLNLSPLVRERMNNAVQCVHPEDPTVKGITHVMWTGAPSAKEADAKNAVFYGSHAIDRSPCGTGTSARMAQLAAKGKLKPGDRFVHESIIGSLFEGRVEAAATVGNYQAIRPSITGWARVTGLNTIFVDPRDPHAFGFQVI